LLYCKLHIQRYLISISVLTLRKWTQSMILLIPDRIVTKDSKNTVSLITLEIIKPNFSEPPMFWLPSEPETMFPFYHFFKIHASGTCRHYARVLSRVTGRSILIGIDSKSTLLFSTPCHVVQQSSCEQLYFTSNFSNHKVIIYRNQYNLIIVYAVLYYYLKFRIYNIHEYYCKQLLCDQ